MSDRLGKHFVLVEFTNSPTAIRRGIDNNPSVADIVRLQCLVVNVLDPLREYLGKPVRVTSGYRSKALNAAIGGSKTSGHMYGEAADIKVDGLSAIELAEAVYYLELPYDQLIPYSEERGGHVHVSHSTRRSSRGQTLFAPAWGGYTAWEPK